MSNILPLELPGADTSYPQYLLLALAMWMFLFKRWTFDMLTLYVINFLKGVFMLEFNICVAVCDAKQKVFHISRMGFQQHTWCQLCILRQRHVEMAIHMLTSSNGNIFRVTGHLCGEFTGQWWIPHTQSQWRGALMFSLICASINGWVNNGEAGDLRRYGDISVSE